mgnify:CR=1 FL=1
MAVTYDPIATTTLSSTSTTITFSSIASSWTDLRLVIVGKNSVTSNRTQLRFNSDSGTNYSRTYIEGNGSTVYSGRNGSGTSILVGNNTTVLGLQTIDIFSYTGSNRKTVLCTTSNDTIGTGTVNRTVGLWRSSAAITNIQLILTDPFDVGTIVTLYGIKAA